MITNPGSKTRVDEVADGLVVDEEPLPSATPPRTVMRDLLDKPLSLPAPRAASAAPMPWPWPRGRRQVLVHCRNSEEADAIVAEIRKASGPYAAVKALSRRRVRGARRGSWTHDVINRSAMATVTPGGSRPAPRPQDRGSGTP
jgi:hypothetical protein